MKTKQPLPFAEPVITDADKKKMEEVKRSVSRVEVISGMFIIYFSRRLNNRTDWLFSLYRIGTDKTIGSGLQPEASVHQNHP